MGLIVEESRAVVMVWTLTRPALRMAKSLLRQGRDMNFDQMLELSAAMQALAHLTEDHIEGVTAVLEKRTGEFSGT